MTNDSAPPDAGEEIARAYREHYSVLEYIVVQRFHVPEDDVRSVIHEVFLAFIRHRERVRDVRAWLVGATFTQCRAYWRARGGEKDLCELGEETEAEARATDVETRVAVSDVLSQLTSRCRELLHLRFFEQYSSEEIARQFDTTVDYARKLVHRCVLNARALFSTGRRSRP